MNIKDINYLIENGLENERSRLIPLSSLEQVQPLEDIAFSESDMMKYSPTPIHSKEKFDQYFRKALELMQVNQAVVFLVYDKTSNRFAGSTRFANISERDGRVEIGWTWLGKAFRRTGLNRNNKLLMLSYAFDSARCERVEFKADGRNTASLKAIEAIGATYEGRLRSHTVMSDGFRRDTVYYSILKEEWPEIKLRIFNAR